MKAKLMFSMCGVALAMSAPCRALGSPVNRLWKGVNKKQRSYVEAYDRFLDATPVPGSKQKARVVDNDVVLLSNIDANATWMKKGVKCEIKNGPGIELERGVFVYDKLNTIVAEAKGGITVWMTKGHLGANRVDLHEACSLLRIKAATGSTPSAKYAGVRFPEIKKTVQKVALKELLGLQLGPYSCTEAQQDLQFEMDVVGARAKVSTIIRMTKSVSLPKQFFTIDGPFTLFMCQGHEEPFFTATFV